MPSNVTDEQIAAYVDGSLEGGDAAEVAEAIEQDPKVRAYADEVRNVNRLLREAFDSPMAEPVSADLQATILGREGERSGGAVVDFVKARITHRPWIGIALAASIALAIGIGSTAVFQDGGSGGGQRIASPGPVATDSPLHIVLETQPSGAISEDGIQVMLSFRDQAGRACREFEVIGEVPDSLEFAIACRTENQIWDVEIVVTGPTTDVGPDGYRPASGPGADALEAMLDALGAQPALSPAAEANLLGRGWR